MLKKILAVFVILVIGCCVIWIVSASPNEVPAPLIPKEKLQQYGYTPIHEDEIESKIIDSPEVVVIEHLLIYENSRVKEDLKRKTLGMVDESVVLFFAVRADVTPDLDNLPILKNYVMKIAEESAKEYFEEELSKYGLNNIQLIEETLEKKREYLFTLLSTRFPSYLSNLLKEKVFPLMQVRLKSLEYLQFGIMEIIS